MSSPETAACSRGGPDAACRPLSSLRPGSGGTLCRIEAGGSLGSRLAELGFVPGTELELVRTAPLRDPLEVRLRGSHFCLRREEADAVWVHPRAA